MSSSIVMMAEMANTARERLDEMQREHYREIARNHLDDLTDAYAQALQRPDDTCPLFGLVNDCCAQRKSSTQIGPIAVATLRG